jgi:hypothetical protein
MGMYATVKFEKTDDGIRQMAIYCGQLVKEGVCHKVTDMCTSWEVDLTGGY